jgi:hypothetical protein
MSHDLAIQSENKGWARDILEGLRPLLPGQEGVLEGVLATFDTEYARVAELRDLLPLSVGAEEIVRKIPAVSVRDRGHRPFAVIAGFQFHLRDSWKIFSDLQLVFGDRGAQAMNPNLLEKV